MASATPPEAPGPGTTPTTPSRAGRLRRRLSPCSTRCGAPTTRRPATGSASRRSSWSSWPARHCQGSNSGLVDRAADPVRAVVLAFWHTGKRLEHLAAGAVLPGVQVPFRAQVPNGRSAVDTGTRRLGRAAQAVRAETVGTEENALM